MAPNTHTGVQAKRHYFEHPQNRLHQRRVLSQPDAVSTENSADQLYSPEGEFNGKKRTLSTALLLGIMYTYSVGGGYGVEESVLGGGVLLTIISTLLIPIFMGMPTALIVSEMATAIPSNAAFLMWINVAFHRIVFFAMVIMSIVFNFIDNALFPVLISEYLCRSMTCSDTTTKLLRLALLVFTYLLNMLGVQAVGVASVLLSIATVMPFLLMFAIHLLKTGFYLNWPAIGTIPKEIDWVTFLTTASWNFCGLEQAGTVAEEIKNPQRTIIRALIPLMGLAYATYIPIIITGVSAVKGPPDFSLWTTGYCSIVAEIIGGNPLRIILIVGSALSAFSQTMSALCTTTQVLAGVAHSEVFPRPISRILSQRNKRFGSYHWTLTLNTVVTGIFCTLLDFGPLIKIDQTLYGIRVVMMFLSFLVLRYKYPHLHRPFKVPLSGYKLALFAIPILLFTALTVIAMVEDTQTLYMTAATVGGSILTSLMYCLLIRKEDFYGRIVAAGVPEDLREE